MNNKNNKIRISFEALNVIVMCLGFLYLAFLMQYSGKIKMNLLYWTIIIFVTVVLVYYVIKLIHHKEEFNVNEYIDECGWLLTTELGSFIFYSFIFLGNQTVVDKYAVFILIANIMLRKYLNKRIIK